MHKDPPRNASRQVTIIHRWKLVKYDMLDFYPVNFTFTLSQITLLQQKNMKLQIMKLAAALVTIIGPAGGVFYSPCELVRFLPQCGLDYNCDGCKCTTPSSIDFN